MAVTPEQSNFLRYHVPRSQVWPGSRGGQRGYVHVHLDEAFDSGRLHRRPGVALCTGKRGWYEREPDGEELCPKCVAISERHHIELGRSS